MAWPLILSPQTERPWPLLRPGSLWEWGQWRVWFLWNWGLSSYPEIVPQAFLEGLVSPVLREPNFSLPILLLLPPPLPFFFFPIKKMVLSFASRLDFSSKWVKKQNGTVRWSCWLGVYHASMRNWVWMLPLSWKSRLSGRYQNLSTGELKTWWSRRPVCQSSLMDTF